MDVRFAAIKSLIKILEQNKTSDEVINSYAEKVSSISELINLTAGTVKFKLTLDFFIENISSRPLKKLSPPVKNILRAAIYELEYIKNPDYAVINSYVEISKIYDKNSSKFINAVLRNFLRKKSCHSELDSESISQLKSVFTTEQTLKQVQGDSLITEKANLNLIKAISINFSHPEWLVERWIETYGIDETIKICEFNNKIPVISIRINTLTSSKAEIINLLGENHIEFTESLISDECLVLKNAGNIKNIAGFKEGFWAVQGESSSLVAKILDPQKGERILDLCAAPGGKTTHIAALMQNSGEIIAVDISQDRIKIIEENCNRLRITCVKTVVSDATTYTDNQKYNRILIDAPCSNTGVLGKRPDARWKRTPEDIKKLTEIQKKILQNASELLKEGGTLVYSTCSIEPEENILLIQEFLNNNNDFAFENFRNKLSLTDENAGFIQILQSQYNTDGFFIAKLKKH
jgi:16S rRNA (cytosine967-C5)-methyltransferase